MKDPMKHLSIPYKGLNDGKHELVFEVTDTFFDHYDNKVINNGHFAIKVEIDKRPRITETLWTIEGKTKVNCDRCLEKINLPIQGAYRLLIKLSEEETSDDEVMYISPDASVIKISDLIYEYIVLSVPTIKVYDCEEENPQPCNLEVLDKLENRLSAESGSSLWEDLKGINFDNN